MHPCLDMHSFSKDVAVTTQRRAEHSLPYLNKKCCSMSLNAKCSNDEVVWATCSYIYDNIIQPTCRSLYTVLVMFQARVEPANQRVSMMYDILVRQ